MKDWIVPVSALTVIILNNFLKMSVAQNDVTSALSLLSDVVAGIVLLFHQLKNKN